YRLILYLSGYFSKAGLQWVCKWLVIMGIACHAISGVGIGARNIYFSLQVQVLDCECVKVFTTGLYSKFISPVTITSYQFFGCKFIQVELAVELQVFCCNSLEVNT